MKITVAEGRVHLDKPIEVEFTHGSFFVESNCCEDVRRIYVGVEDRVQLEKDISDEVIRFFYDKYHAELKERNLLFCELKEYLTPERSGVSLTDDQRGVIKDIVSKFMLEE